jgi:MarR family 2-MHQ and catechol resistance regulon transcriptional repressor
MTATTRDDGFFTTWSLLQQAHHLIYKNLDQRMARLGSTQAQAAVLVTIKSAGKPLPLSRIARLLAQESQSVTSLVDRLEAQGLVHRAPSSRDRRVIYVELLPAGDALFQKIFPATLEGLTETFDAAGDRELEALTKSLQRLRDRSADVLHLSRVPFDVAEWDGSFASPEAGVSVSA